VLLDTGLFVLLTVGRTSPQLIARHKRLDAWDTDDYMLLERHLESADAVLVTPNILTEASNLLRQTPEPARGAIQRCFRAMVHDIEEHPVASRDAVSHGLFVEIGLADAASLAALRSDVVLLTADIELYLGAFRSGHVAENFHHLRAGPSPA
jgi:hypothetical protein